MIIGTRGSALAMEQTNIFINALLNDGISSSEYIVKEVRVSGDVDQISPLHELQGFGAFVRELDDALLKGTIDVSVNSMKDMPIKSRPGIIIPAILPRGDVRDVVLPGSLDELDEGSTIGTSSLRRSATIRRTRPDLVIKPLRGNIQTRMRKLDEGEYDAIILAKAGLDRMGIDLPYAVLDVEDMVPAPAQGAIAIACRENDTEIVELLSKIDDLRTREEVTLERAIMEATGAGCTSPIGINASLQGDCFTLCAESFISDLPVKFTRTIRRTYSEDEVNAMAKELRGL